MSPLCYCLRQARGLAEKHDPRIILGWWYLVLQDKPGQPKDILWLTETVDHLVGRNFPT